MRPFLAAYVRRSLGGRRRRVVEQHLVDCAGCGVAHGELSRVNRRLRGRQVLPVDVGGVGVALGGLKAQVASWLSASSASLAASGMVVASVLAPAADVPPSVPTRPMAVADAAPDDSSAASDQVSALNADWPLVTILSVPGAVSAARREGQDVSELWPGMPLAVDAGTPTAAPTAAPDALVVGGPPTSSRVPDVPAPVAGVQPGSGETTAPVSAGGSDVGATAGAAATDHGQAPDGSSPAAGRAGGPPPAVGHGNEPPAVGRGGGSPPAVGHGNEPPAVGRRGESPPAVGHGNEPPPAVGRSGTPPGEQGAAEPAVPAEAATNGSGNGASPRASGNAAAGEQAAAGSRATAGTDDVSTPAG